MSRQGLDADTAETVAGVVRLLRRAAELVWAAVDADGAGSPRQVHGLGIDLAADEARNLLPDAIRVDGPVPVGDEPAGLLRSAEQLLRRVTTPGAGTGLDGLRAQVADLVWERTPVSAADRRTVGELLADSDELARETLLDATPAHAPAMVRSWNQLVGSAAELWVGLAFGAAQPVGIGSDGAVAGGREAIGRSVTAGHWPGQGPTDERLIQIADNLTRARHLVQPHDRPSQQAPPETQRDIQDLHGQLMHTLYVAAHGTAVALSAHVTELQHRLEAAGRRRQPLAERPTALEITAPQGMIARFDGFEQLAGAYLFGLSATSANPDQVRQAAPATRLKTALAAWEVQAHRTLANHPDPADLVRVARVQALITSTTNVLTEAAARKGHINGDVLQRLMPALEANQVAWSRAAKRWGELTNPASRTDPTLVAAASEVRAAVTATATNPTGWATPEQLASRLDLPDAVKTLHLGMVASVDIAYVVRDTAADHPGLTAPARIIGMRAQGEAEIAIEQGETRYEGVTWTTRSQIAANQLIPLPEPVRRGLINLADDVIATTNHAVAAAAQLHPSHVKGADRSGHQAHSGRSTETLQIARARSHPKITTPMNCTDPVRGRLVEVTNQTGVTSNQAAAAASLSRDRTALLVSAMKLPKPIRERPSIAGSPRPGPASRRSHRSARWSECVAEAGLAEGLRFHDLRHTGNTLAASSGASTREPMHRMGHASMRAALIYQHATCKRDREIAAAIDAQIGCGNDNQWLANGP